MLNMFGQNKLLFLLIFFLLNFTLEGQNNKSTHLSDNFIENSLESVLRLKKSELTNLVDDKFKSISRKVVYQISEDDSYNLAVANNSNINKTIKINKLRLSELLKMGDIWFIYNYQTDKRHNPGLLFFEYAEHITYNTKDVIMLPELYFELTEEELKYFNSPYIKFAREAFYKQLILFLMAHELGHFALSNHFESDIGWKAEIEADSFAFSIWRKNEVPVTYLIPVYAYLMTLEKKNFEDLYSSTHPNPELRMIEMLHNQFLNIQDIKDVIERFGSSNFNSNDQYNEYGKAILRSIDNFILTKSHTSKNYHKKRAENNELYHQLLMGYRYWVGFAKWEENLEKAEYWLRLSSENNNKNAAFIYAMFLEFEKGDINGAHDQYHKALDLGNELARLHLTQIHILEDKGKLKKLEGNSTLYKLKIDDCMEECLIHYKIDKKECELDLCKKHLANMNTWILSTRSLLIEN